MVAVVFRLVILTTVLVFFGAMVVANYVDQMAEARRRKTVMDICDRIIPAMYNEMDKQMDSMLEKVMTKSMELSKKMVKEMTEMDE